MLFISHTPEERRVFRSVLYFTDSQCKHFKAGVDLPELGRSENTDTHTHTIAAASAEFCMKWGNLRGL